MKTVEDKASHLLSLISQEKRLLEQARAMRKRDQPLNWVACTPTSDHYRGAHNLGWNVSLDDAFVKEHLIPIVLAKARLIRDEIESFSRAVLEEEK